MSRSARLLLIAAAWALPVAWVLVALSAGPSDGSVVWSSPLTSDERWGARLVVLETYGDTALEVGDEVETIGGVTVTDLLAGERTADLAVGDQVSYGVRRAGEGLARDQEITVTLVQYAAPEALRENVPVVIVALLTLTAGSVAFWLQPLAIATRAFLGASSLLPTALTSAPWGLGAVDVAGARGLWPHAVGEIACTLGVGLALLAACTLRAPRGWLRARPWVAPVAILAPFAGYAAWVGITLSRTDAGPEQTQALLSILAPSLVVAVPLAATALALTVSRARSREVRLAARLALIALVAGVAVRLLLVELPDRLGDGPILPWDVLLLLVAPPLLAGSWSRWSAIGSRTSSPSCAAPSCRARSRRWSAPPSSWSPARWGVRRTSPSARSSPAASWPSPCCPWAWRCSAVSDAWSTATTTCAAPWWPSSAGSTPRPLRPRR